MRKAESARLWRPEEERDDWDDEVREGGACVYVCVSERVCVYGLNFGSVLGLGKWWLELG